MNLIQTVLMWIKRIFSGGAPGNVPPGTLVRKRNDADLLRVSELSKVESTTQGSIVCPFCNLTNDPTMHYDKPTNTARCDRCFRSVTVTAIVLRLNVPDVYREAVV